MKFLFEIVMFSRVGSNGNIHPIHKICWFVDPSIYYVGSMSLTRWSIDPLTNDLFEIAKDRVLLWYVSYTLCLLCSFMGSFMIIMLSLCNHTLCLDSSKAIGCTVVNIGTPKTWLSLANILVTFFLRVSLSICLCPGHILEAFFLDKFRTEYAVVIRVIAMVAFLLQFCVLQSIWPARSIEGWWRYGQHSPKYYLLSLNTKNQTQ